MSTVNQDQDFWKRKLLAFLHDPPHKPFNIAGHEEARLSLLLKLGLTETDYHTEFDRRCDWRAAAADRFAFPKSHVVYSDWRENNMEFAHPLIGSRLKKQDYGKGAPSSAPVGEEWVNSALSGIPQNDANFKDQFIRVWRLWPDRCAREKHPLLAYAVADTRIPDHTLWHHNAITSAFMSTGNRPAFLMFQIGPVQDFIKQSRKLLDLWSGSYLISYLIAQGMLSIAEEIGPDCIIYPNLRNVPLADWHWFKTGRIKDLQRASHANELLTPNLPNRFLALVPADRGHELANHAQTAIGVAWNEIASSVHQAIAKEMGNNHPGWDVFWANQTTRFPVVDWEIHEWTSSDEVFKHAGQSTPPLAEGGWENHPLNTVRKWMIMMENDAESWQGNENAGFAWALHYALMDWKFAARKNTRPFNAWNQPTGTVPKDNLNGRDEILGGIDKSQWEPFWETLKTAMPSDFKGQQRLGAISVIKRLFYKTYLGGVLGWDKWDIIGRNRPNFESVPDIAQIDKAMETDDEGVDNYYAVLAMDGDDMGKWVSGVKAPKLTDVLSKEMRSYFVGRWDASKAGGILAVDVKRPLSPSYHASLSEALGNFALYCAQQIVSEFNGQLIYAGGDDVLAMLPSSQAMDCAQALQLVFRGQNPGGLPDNSPVKKTLNTLFEFPGQGFVRCRLGTGSSAHLRPNWPLMVPGNSASVGIAIGHVHAPMQDVIQAARNAEATAKKVPGKAAFCLSILKRSGESAEIATQWDSGVIGVWNELDYNIHGLTGRFPYRVVQLLKPLLQRTGNGSDEGWEPAWTDELKAVTICEIAHALRNQTSSGKTKEDAKAIAHAWCSVLHPALPPRRFIHFWMAWAFMDRTKPENKDKKAVS